MKSFVSNLESVEPVGAQSSLFSGRGPSAHLTDFDALSFLYNVQHIRCAIYSLFAISVIVMADLLCCHVMKLSENSVLSFYRETSIADKIFKYLAGLVALLTIVVRGYV